MVLCNLSEGYRPFNCEEGEELAGFFKNSKLELANIESSFEKKGKIITEWIIGIRLIFNLNDNRELVVVFFNNYSIKYYIKGNLLKCLLEAKKTIIELLNKLISIELTVLEEKISIHEKKKRKLQTELDRIIDAVKALNKTALTHNIDVKQATTQEMFKLEPNYSEANPYVFLEENQQFKPVENPMIETIEDIFSAYPLTCFTLRYLSYDLPIDWQSINVSYRDGAGAALFVFMSGIVLFFEDPTVSAGRGKQVTVLQEERVHEEEINKLLHQVLLNIICIYAIAIQKQKQNAEMNLAREQDSLQILQNRIFGLSD